MRTISSELRWIASPYLQAVPAYTVRAWTAAGLPPELADLLRRESDARVVWNAIRGRLVVLGPDAMRLLEGIRAARRTTDAHRASKPFASLADHQLVLEEAAAYRLHAYRSIEIEINRHCNFRCAFCPVSLTPKSKGFMADETYELVINRAVEYGARSISLNHYSEPTLDPGFSAKVSLATGRGLAVRLHTNASRLDEQSISELARAGDVTVVVNLPSVDRTTYARVTRTKPKVFDQVMENLWTLHRARVRTLLSINTPGDSTYAEVARINEELASMFGVSGASATDDRAGRLQDGLYAISSHHRGLLRGCALAVDQLNVSHEGKAFLCCQDFDQEVVLGDLKDSSIRELAEGDRAVQVRRWIFGADEPPHSFLCAKCEWTSPRGDEDRAILLGSTAKWAALEAAFTDPPALRELSTVTSWIA
jgi:Radical SAM superfamily/Iron-sulfur cluster-binding domain